MTADTLSGGRALQHITERGWRLGFANMLANENGRWWGTRRWLIQLAIFVLLINGLVLIVSATSQGMTQAQGLAEVGDVFMGMLIAATTIGVVVIVQGAIIGEKQLGTAAWVMSKPASRSGFVLAKLVAYSLAMLLLAFPVPTALYYAECLYFFGQGPAIGALAGALGLAALHMIFYLALTLALGTLFDGRGPVAGIGIGLLLGGLLVGNSLPLLPYGLPWPLPDLAISTLLARPLPPEWPIPVIAVAAWIIVFVAVAVWRFDREEF